MLHRGSVQVIQWNLRPPLMIRANAQYLVDLVGRTEITSTVVAENASMNSVARSFEVLIVG